MPCDFVCQVTVLKYKVFFMIDEVFLCIKLIMSNIFTKIILQVHATKKMVLLNKSAGNFNPVTTMLPRLGTVLMQFFNHSLLFSSKLH